MLRRLLESFSATHLTIMFVAAVLAPGAVVAAVAYQPVAIVNPSTGSHSFVDNNRRLYVLDPLAAYANDPSRLVNISYEGLSSSGVTVYTVPANTALIIKSVQISYYQHTGTVPAFSYLFDESLRRLLTFESQLVSNTESVVFAAGVIVRPGKLTWTPGGSTSSYHLLNVQGYLVPASAVPAVAAAASDQIVSSGAGRNRQLQ